MNERERVTSCVCHFGVLVFSFHSFSDRSSIIPIQSNPLQSPLFLHLSISLFPTYPLVFEGEGSPNRTTRQKTSYCIQQHGVTACCLSDAVVSYSSFFIWSFFFLSPFLPFSPWETEFWLKASSCSHFSFVRLRERNRERGLRKKRWRWRRILQEERKTKKKNRRKRNKERERQLPEELKFLSSNPSTR